MYPSNFEYFTPDTLAEAFDLLDRFGEDAKLLAGGQSLIPTMKLRLAQPRCLVDLATANDMPRGIRVEGDHLSIGAFVLHAEVGESQLVRQKLPALAEAADVIGDVQVRNRGTIGGSAAHADPGADFPVILTALNATFVVASRSGTRSIPVDEFFVDFFTTALAPEEILTEVHVPLPPSGASMAYAKLGNPASGYVVVSSGVLLEVAPSGECASCRIAVGGIQATPFRAASAEDALLGQRLAPEVIASAAARAADGADVFGDLYASADYKRQLATVYVRRAVEAAVSRNGARA
jgi:carbon-monoxide dehydrogenase medium subunit